MSCNFCLSAREILLAIVVVSLTSLIIYCSYEFLPIRQNHVFCLLWHSWQIGQTGCNDSLHPIRIIVRYRLICRITINHDNKKYVSTNSYFSEKPIKNGNFWHLAGANHSAEWLLFAVQKTVFDIFYRFIQRFSRLAGVFCYNIVTRWFGKNQTPKKLYVNAMWW